MNLLSLELLKGLLPENELPNKKEIVGMFGGGFKPPTVGHLEVVKRALSENPQMDKMIVLVGSGVRDSISQEESVAIWNIYKKYLGSKVEIIPSSPGKAPIGDIYSYARKNPNQDVYWFIGAREGNEDDFQDIEKRTRSLRKLVYQNVTVKPIVTTGAVSGTKARQALLAGDKEGFIQFLPDIPEVDQIWDMLKDVVAEEKTSPLNKYDREELKKGIEVEKEHTDNPKIALKIALDHLDEDPKYYTKLATLGLEERVSFNADFISKGDVEFVDDMADRKLAPVDVDLSGGHFFDRLNDPRNFPDISIEELEEFFDKLADEKEEFIEFLKKYKDVVVKDTETNINIPFMKMANKAIAKTIMRKKNFMTSNKVLPLKEGRYDREVTMISRMIINFFKANIGKEVEETFEEAGELSDGPYDVELYLFPTDFDTLGPLPFIINAAGDEDTIAIQINYNPDSFPEAYNELIAELKDAIRHELEHTSQGRFDKGVKPDGIDQDDLDLVDYLTLDYEIPAFVQGIYKNAKTKKIPFSQALQNFLDERMDELDPDEEAKVKKIYTAWAKKNLPAAQINEADPKKGTGKKPKGSGRRLYIKEFLLEIIPTDVINSFNIQDTLVQDVWDGEKLKPEVKEKLLKIAQDFFESLDLPENVKLKDIKLTGSLANYNWSKFSDFDLHLVLDFSDVDDDEEFVRNYFMAKKGIWNDAHDITIYGFPVEVYVENEGESHTASGLYSILNDKWIVVPKKKEVMIDKDDISTKAEDYISQTEDVQDLYDEGKYEEVITKVDKIKERLRNMRSSGLEKGGEYSVENLAFKVLRRSDIIGQLNDLKSKSYDTIMTINENIDVDSLNPNILSLTQYMNSNGLNLKPYPKVKFIKNDKENAEDLLGKTAYYDPNAKLVVLYTLNRHPKDVLRSYAHELIHHHQNLNGTLQPFQTQNTNEDGDLDTIEREAYENGNILFRNWEDSIKN